MQTSLVVVVSSATGFLALLVLAGLFIVWRRHHHEQKRVAAQQTYGANLTSPMMTLQKLIRDMREAETGTSKQEQLDAALSILEQLLARSRGICAEKEADRACVGARPWQRWCTSEGTPG